MPELINPYTMIVALAFVALFIIVMRQRATLRKDYSAPPQQVLRRRLIELTTAARGAGYAEHRVILFTDQVNGYLSCESNLRAYDWLRMFDASVRLFKGESIEWQTFTPSQREQLIIEAHRATEYSALTDPTLSTIAGEALLYSMKEKFDAVQYRVSLLNQRLPESRSYETH